MDDYSSLKRSKRTAWVYGSRGRGPFAGNRGPVRAVSGNAMISGTNTGAVGKTGLAKSIQQHTKSLQLVGRPAPVSGPEEEGKAVLSNSMIDMDSIVPSGDSTDSVNDIKVPSSEPEPRKFETDNPKLHTEKQRPEQIVDQSHDGRIHKEENHHIEIVEGPRQDPPISKEELINSKEQSKEATGQSDSTQSDPATTQSSTSVRPSATSARPSSARVRARGPIGDSRLLARPGTASSDRRKEKIKPKKSEAEDETIKSAEEVANGEGKDKEESEAQLNREIVIHVCDEARNISKDFKCSRKKIIKNMKYFEQYLGGHDDEIFTDRPELDDSSVVSVLISSHFLQMKVLVRKCLRFIHDHANGVLRLPIDLSCINDDLFTDLAKQFSTVEVENLVDRKDKMRTRLFEKLVSLRTDKNSSLKQCKQCGLIIPLEEDSLWGGLCGRAERAKLDRHGNIMAGHCFSTDFDARQWATTVMEQDNLTPREMAWRLWGLSHYLSCRECGQRFPVGHLHWCVYHPGDALFDSSGGSGRYSCCNARAVDLTSHAIRVGCSARRHAIAILDIVDEDSDEAQGDTMSPQKNDIKSRKKLRKKKVSGRILHRQSSASKLTDAGRSASDGVQGDTQSSPVGRKWNSSLNKDLQQEIMTRNDSDESDSDVEKNDNITDIDEMTVVSTAERFSQVVYVPFRVPYEPSDILVHGPMDVGGRRISHLHHRSHFSVDTDLEEEDLAHDFEDNVIRAVVVSGSDNLYSGETIGGPRGMGMLGFKVRTGEGDHSVETAARSAARAVRKARNMIHAARRARNESPMPETGPSNPYQLKGIRPATADSMNRGMPPGRILSGRLSPPTGVSSSGIYGAPARSKPPRPSSAAIRRTGARNSPRPGRGSRIKKKPKGGRKADHRDTDFNVDTRDLSPRARKEYLDALRHEEDVRVSSAVYDRLLSMRDKEKNGPLPVQSTTRDDEVVMGFELGVSPAQLKLRALSMHTVPGSSGQGYGSGGTRPRSGSVPGVPLNASTMRALRNLAVQRGLMDGSRSQSAQRNR